MNVGIIKIEANPHNSLFLSRYADSFEVGNHLSKDILSYFYSVADKENSSIELLFIKKIEIIQLLIVRINELVSDVSTEQVVNNINSILTDYYFKTSVLGEKEVVDCIKMLRSSIKDNISVVTKSEKIVQSKYNYSCYYYVDYLQPNNDANRFERLFSALSNCEEGFVSFSLIPTILKPDEYYLIKILHNETQTLYNGVNANGQLLKDYSLENCVDNYKSFIEKYSQQLFITNIAFEAKNTNDRQLILSALSSLLSSSNGKENDLLISHSFIENLSDNFFDIPLKIYDYSSFNLRDQRIWNGNTNYSILFRLPYLYHLDELSHFFVPPTNSGELKGVKTNWVANDYEPLNDIDNGNQIVVGSLLNNAQLIKIEESDFTRHSLIVGMPGTGKTTFAMKMLLDFYERGIPFLAIEPAKTEYRSLMSAIPDLQIFTPGNSDIVPFIFNPFLPPKGITLEHYIPSLISAFNIAFSMETPLDVIFAQAIRTCYAKHGWKDDSTIEDKGVKKFGMFEFILTFKNIVSSSSYKNETKGNIETGGTFRLLNLINQNRQIFDTVNSVGIETLLEKPTIIELNAISNQEHKSLLMSLILIQVYLYTINGCIESNKLKNIMLIDEAHILLDASTNSSESQSFARNTIINMIAEIRAYGTGIIIADQTPSRVSREVIANTDIKVAFRLVDKKERDLIGSSTNLNSNLENYLSRLGKGEAIVYYSGLENAKIIRTENIRETKTLPIFVESKDVKTQSIYWSNNKELLMPYNECSICPQCKKNKTCSNEIRNKARYYSNSVFIDIGNRITDKEQLAVFVLCFHKYIIQKEINSHKHVPIKTLCNCAKIHFIREALLNRDIYLSEADISKILITSMIGE